MGENNFAARPVALYGVALLFAAIAYFIQTKALNAHHGRDSSLAKALGKDFKGKISVAVYAAAIALAFIHALAACGLYLLVAIMFLIPDPRIEKNMIS